MLQAIRSQQDPRIDRQQIGTSAGGPNWVEYLTGCYEGLPSQCNDFVGGQKELWDFAFAGADISTTYLPLHHNYSVDLDSQVRQWDQYARPFLPVNISNGLAAFYIGLVLVITKLHYYVKGRDLTSGRINDVSDSDHNTTVISFPDFYASLVSTLFESVETVYSGGYRSFLFMNLPPLERTPGNVVAASQGQPLSPNVTQVQQYNDALAAGVAGFGSKHADVDAMLFDVHTFLNGVIDNGEEYGLKNVTGYCPNYDAPDIATNYAAYGCIPIPEYFWYSKYPTICFLPRDW